jgi:hypothetical protein
MFEISDASDEINSIGLVGVLDSDGIGYYC